MAQDGAPRDPRFDPRCRGKFDSRHFVKNYSFIQDVRQRELAELQKALRDEKDPEKRDRIQRATSRYRNKMVDFKKKEDEQCDKQSANKPKQGRSSKSCDKKAKLVDKFKELKESGKLAKYLERKRKKLIKRDRSSLSK